MISRPTPTLTFAEDGPAGAICNVVHHRYAPGDGFPMHAHAFCEVFWVDGGSGTHDVNGSARPLGLGDIVFVRPEDRHACRAGREGLEIINLSFPHEVVAGLAQRHPKAWPWRDGAEPLMANVALPTRERLAFWAGELARIDDSALELECCLLDLTRLVSRQARTSLTAGLPLWLVDAVGVFCDPRHLPGGTERLAKLCGRGQAHINRVIRASQGRTATALVNQCRMEWAATTLRLRHGPVADVAQACGLVNLAHFYAVFQAHFGMTPRQYRQSAQRALPGLSDSAALEARRGYYP